MSLFDSLGFKNNKLSRKSEDELLKEFKELLNSVDKSDNNMLFEISKVLVEKYNNPVARMQLAKFYFIDFEKLEIERDAEKAIEYISPLIDANDLNAIKYAVAICKATGDNRSFYSYAEKAALLGDPKCCDIMGDAYQNGNHFVILDKAKSKERYKTAADKGHKLAAFKYAYQCDEYSNEQFKYYKIAAEGEDGIPIVMNMVGGFYLEGLGDVEKNYEEAAKWFKKAADGGNEYGMYYYAKMHKTGIGCEKNIDLAKEYFKKSADKGHEKAAYEYAEMCDSESNEQFKYYKIAAEGKYGVPFAMNMAGRFYEEGWGDVEKNAEEAVKWYKKAADGGDKYGMYNYARMLKLGWGCEKDIALAKENYKKAADKGYKKSANEYAKMCDSESNEQFKYYKIAAEGKDGVPYAMNMVGRFYSNGWGDVEKNAEEAVKWFKKATDGGDKYGMYNYALKLYNGICCEKNIALAKEYYKKAADKGIKEAAYEYAKMCDSESNEQFKYYKIAAEGGIPEAMASVGEYYSEGYDEVKKDRAKAVEWLKKASDRGNKKGQAFLAAEYLEGGDGVEQNKVEAFKLACSAASGDSPSPKAMNIVGTFYSTGEANVIINRTEAVKWFKKAADGGYVNAMYNYGICCLLGKGCEKDYDEAYKWLLKAANNGQPNSQKYIGDFYAEGKGGVVEKDIKKALCYYEQSAENGIKAAFEEIKKLSNEENPDAMLKYAECLFKGTSFVEKNPEEALALCLKLADNYSFSEADFMIAKYYNNQYGAAEQNIALAKEYYKKSADKGHEKAAYEYAEMCDRRSNEQFTYYKIAAEGKDGVPYAMNMVGRFYHKGWGDVEKNAEEAVKWYKKAANCGDKVGMYNYASMLESGSGCKKNTDLAKEYYKKAADKGIKEAAYSYAYRCDSKSNEKFKYYKIAAEGKDGVPNAMNMVGRFYDEGWGDVEKNYEEAVKWYKKAADGGDKYGMYNYALKLYDGIGCEKDTALAKEYYKKAADKGHELAANIYANLFDEQSNEQFKYYKIAAEGEDGVPNAMNMVGRFYDEGWGDVEKNAEEAVKWYKKAADGGDKQGMHNYATMLKSGSGCEKNVALAKEYYKKSADKGHKLAANSYAIRCDEQSNEQFKYYKIAAEGEDGVPNAMNMVGGFYSEGWGDVEKNYEEAVKWYKKAADSGDKYGMYNYALMLEMGSGCEKNIALAKEYYMKAADKGHKLSLYRYAINCDRGSIEQIEYLETATMGKDGVPEAMVKLGDYYANETNDIEEAIKWYKKANERGAGYRELGALYYYKYDSVSGFQLKEDIEKAYEVFAKEQGYLERKFKFGLYLRGKLNNTGSNDKNTKKAKQDFEAFIKKQSKVLDEVKYHLKGEYYVASVTRCRTYLENMLDECCKRCGINIVAPEFQDNPILNKINKLADVIGFSDSYLSSLHKIRVLGNRGAHSGIVTKEEAEEALNLLENDLKKVCEYAFTKSGTSVVNKNRPDLGGNYYNEKRKYRGKLSYVFDSNKLNISSTFRELYPKAKDGDIRAMLDLAIAFLPKEFKGEYAINDNQLFNSPIGYNNDNQMYAYDKRYYYWIFKAVCRATDLYINGKFKDIPLEYISNALLEVIKLNYYICIEKNYKPIEKREKGGMPVYFDNNKCLDQMWGDHNLYSNGFRWTVEMLIEIIYAYGNRVIDFFHDEKKVLEIEYYLYCYYTVKNYEIIKEKGNNTSGLYKVERENAISECDIGIEFSIDFLKEVMCFNKTKVTERLYRETAEYVKKLFDVR